MKLKRCFLIVLVLMLLTAFSVSAFALPPVYQNGSPDKSGYWSPYTGYVKGFFTLEESLEDMFLNITPLTFPADIYQDYRDEDGNGLCFYMINMGFADGIGLNSSVERPYNTIQMIFREYDSSGEGYLNDLALAVAGTDTYVSLFHTAGTVETTTYSRYSSIFFGFDYDNYWIADDYDNDAVFDWYTNLLSGPVINDQVQQRYGIFRPVIYSFNVITPGGGSSGGAGPGGGSSGGVITPPSDEDYDAASAFGSFIGLIINSFNSLLSIEFFGGLFALRDIFGLVIVLSLLTLFLRWFAGG